MLTDTEIVARAKDGDKNLVGDLIPFGFQVIERYRTNRKYEDIISEMHWHLFRAIRRISEGGIDNHMYALRFITNTIRKGIARFLLEDRTVVMKSDVIYDRRRRGIKIPDITTILNYEVQEALAVDNTTNDFVIDLHDVIKECNFDADLQRTLDLRLQGLSSVEIAKELGLHKSAIIQRMEKICKKIRFQMESWSRIPPLSKQ